MRLRTLCYVSLLAASLNAAELVTNGDFSAGLAGWTTTNAGPGLGGTVEVLSALDVVTPASAGQFAVLSTGPAATLASSTPTFVELSQEVTVTTADTYQLMFNYSFLTTLFTGTFADPNALDRFLVSLTPAAGPALDAISDDVSNTGFLLLPGAPAATAGGSNFFEYTPLQAFSQSYVLDPGTYTLAFRVENDSDSLFDSGMIVDGVSLSNSPGNAVVPEPSTFVLLGGALLSLGFWRKRSA